MCPNESLAIVICKTIVQWVAKVSVSLLIIFVSLYVTLRQKPVRAVIMRACHAIINELEENNVSKDQNTTDQLQSPTHAEAESFSRESEESIDKLLESVYESDDALNQLIEKEMH